MTDSLVPSQCANVATADAVAAPGDLIVLGHDYNNDTATLTKDNLIVIGECTTLAIVLTMQAGVHTLSLGGAAPITVGGSGTIRSFLRRGNPG